MRKYTFLMLMAVISIQVFSQRSSFEIAEGYNPGQPVNGVNGWTETTPVPDHFLATDEKASAGSQSLKMVYNPNQPLITADWNFDTPLQTRDGLEISMDIYAPGNGTVYWKIMSGDAYAGFIIVQDEYLFPARVTNVNPVPLAMAEVNVGEFNNIKLIYNYSQNLITYYLNGNQIFIGEIWGSSGQIDSYSFECFLFSDIYADNFETNGYMETEETENPQISHYLSDERLYILSSKRLENISLFDLSGKLLKQQKTDRREAYIPISDLKPGIYLIRLIADGKTDGFRILKK